jgi:hypothetical protein
MRHIAARRVGWSIRTRDVATRRVVGWHGLWLVRIVPRRWHRAVNDIFIPHRRRVVYRLVPHSYTGNIVVQDSHRGRADLDGRPAPCPALIKLAMFGSLVYLHIRVLSHFR